MFREYTDYCQEKGYIKATERITDVNSGKGYVELIVERTDSTSRIVKFSEEENQEVHNLVKPKLATFLNNCGKAINVNGKSRTIHETCCEVSGLLNRIV